MAKEKLKLAKNGQWRLEEDPVEKGVKSTLAGVALAGATLLNPGKAVAQSHTQMQAPDKTAYASIEHTPTDESTLNTRTFGPYKVTTMLEPRSNIAGQQEHKSSALTHHVELVGKDHSLEHAKILTAELKGSGIEPSHVLGLKPGDSYVSNKTFQGTASASKGVASFPWNRVDR
jgi:hypothetical protein